MLKYLWLVAVSGMLASAEPLKTLDLKPFVGSSPFDTIGATWLPPRGLQVIDGTPFQIDGVFIMYGNYQSQKNRPGKTNVNGIVVGRAFESLHLLAGAQAITTDGTPLAKLHFQYADGSSNSLELIYGTHVRNWFGPWHEADAPMADPNARESWRFLFTAAASSDRYLRLYHVILTNPVPTKEVRTLAFESLKKPAGLMIVAMSVGPHAFDRQPATIAPLQSPFPDLRPRTGEKIQGRGIVKRMTGEPIAGARIRVMKVRTFTEGYNSGTENDEAVGQSAVTDETGHFTLPPLRDDRVYNLVAAADGFESAPFGGADPKSDPIELRLKPSASDQKFFIRGRIVGPDDKPLSVVLVEPYGVGVGGGTSWGGSAGFPEQILTDSKGEFVLGRREPFDRLQVKVNARGLARTNIWLPPTNITQTIKLEVGSVLRGRVVKAGQPLANLKVAVSGSDRSSEVFVGRFETKTDNNGAFVLTNLPSNTAWFYYGVIDSFKAYGALPPRPTRTGASDELVDLGNLEVKPGLRLTGTIKTRNGEPLPKKLTVYAGNDNADGSQSNIDTNGNFAFDGMFSGTLSVSVNANGWKLSGANRSIDQWNPFRLTGTLESDKDDLLIIIEPGSWENSYNSANGQLPSQDWPQNHPLFGAEKSGPYPITLAGQVLDDKTGLPLTKFKIIPGYKPPSAPPAPKPIIKSLAESFTGKTPAIPRSEQPYWMYGRAETFSTSNFVVEFVPLQSTPMLRVEADNYIAYQSLPIETTTSNLVIRLKPGAGPNGIVLLPDGKPAENATVAYAVAREQMSYGSRKLSVYGQAKTVQVTGKDGKFSFPNRPQGQTLFVCHEAGWAEESVERGGNNLSLKLQPWAHLIGTLVDANGNAMTNVDLGLTMPHDWQNDAFLNLQQRTHTDAQGRFQFLDVPPRRIEVQRIVPAGPVPSRGWTYVPQTWLFVKPGTNDLGKVTYDKPPPPPLLEQLKQKIGL